MARKNPHAVALGRRGGKAGKGKTSPAKAAAARENGTKGGRPSQNTTASRISVNPLWSYDLLAEEYVELLSILRALFLTKRVPRRQLRVQLMDRMHAALERAFEPVQPPDHSTSIKDARGKAVN